MVFQFSAFGKNKRIRQKSKVNMPKKGKTHHVVPNSEGGWDVKRGGANRASAHTDKKQDAIDIAREISRNQQTELKIHDRKGVIRESDSHGNDKFPPKG